MARQPATIKAPPRAAKAAHISAPSDSSGAVQAAETPDTADREQAIREAAYASYEARGCEPGHELDDWLQAEALLKQREGEPEHDTD